MEILFGKWWMRGLLKPCENGLLKNCGSETIFVKELMEVIKLLKLVFADAVTHEMFTSKFAEDFVMEKRYYEFLA